MQRREYHKALRASIAVRLLAAIVDGVCLLVAFAALMQLARGASWLMPSGISPALLEEDAFLAVAALIAHFLLNGYLMATRSQTVGKRILNIAVVRQSTNIKTTFPQVALRSLMSPALLLLMTSGFALPITIVDHLLVFRKRRRCLHDNLFRTDVLKADAVTQLHAAKATAASSIHARIEARSAQPATDPLRRLAGLDAYFRRHVKQQIPRFDRAAAERGAASRRRRLYWYGAGMCVIAVFFLSQADYIALPFALETLVLLLFGVFFIGTFFHGVFLLVRGGSRYRFDDEYKSFMAEHACRFLRLSFEQDARSFPRDMFLNSGLEKFEDDGGRSTKIGSGVSSRSGDLDFDACRCEKTVRGRKNLVHTFEGVLIEVRFPSRIGGTAFVSTDNAGAHLPRVRTGDPVFDTLFRVRCSDEYLARRLVSQRFVEQMLGLHEKFVSGQRPLSVALQSDKLLAKVGTARDQTTEFPLAPRDDHFENLKNYATRLAYLLDMVDCLRALPVQH